MNSTVEIAFSRNIKQLNVQITEDGVFIIGAWDVGILKDTIIGYLKTYGKSADRGFSEYEGEVILSHSSCKITLQPEEAAELIDLVRTSYPEAGEFKIHSELVKVH